MWEQRAANSRRAQGDGGEPCCGEVSEISHAARDPVPTAPRTTDRENALWLTTDVLVRLAERIAERLGLLPTVTPERLARGSSSSDRLPRSSQTPPAGSPFPNHHSGRLPRLPWGYEPFDRDPNQEPRRTRCARRSRSRCSSSRGSSATSGWERSRRSWTAACCPSSPSRLRSERGSGSALAEVRGQIIPASPHVGAGLLPPLALPTLPPVRQLEEVPAAAIVGHDHNDIERPCVGRGIIEVDTRSIGIIEFSANQGQEAAQCARCCARSPSAGRRNDDDAGRSRRGARARGHESRLGSRRER
jgi:hypothetical protein